MRSFIALLGEIARRFCEFSYESIWQLIVWVQWIPGPVPVGEPLVFVVCDWPINYGHIKYGPVRGSTKVQKFFLFLDQIRYYLCSYSFRLQTREKKT